MPLTPKEPSMSAPVKPPVKPKVPPLRNGDHLTRDEFERRYEAMPESVKAELIEGVVYLAAAVRAQEHGEPHADLLGWLSFYRAYTPGVRAGDNSTLRLDLDNDPQPDAYLRIEHERGGQATVDDDGYVSGPPELVAEVAASSVSIDRNTKFRVYRRNGVREYIIWRVEDEAIDWFVLRGTQYEPLPPDAAGLLKSEVFPGLWLDPAALLGGDLARVLAVLQQGLASLEHTAFVARLPQASTS
jgi:Uma2 family endonuclease